MKKEERDSYIKALLYIAMSDHSLDQNEVSHLIKVGEKNGLSQEAAEDLMYESLYSKETLRDILSDIKKKDTKEDLIRDLLTICYADGHYSKEEWEGVSIVSSMLGIKGKTLGKIHDDVKAKEKNRRRIDKVNEALDKVKDSLGDAADVGRDGVYNAGKFILDSGEDALHAIAHGLSRLGANISITLASLKETKEQNIKLRNKLEELEMNEAMKQRIIVKMNAEIESLREQLQVAIEKGQEHAEIISALEETIDELMITRGMLEEKQIS